MKRTIQNEQGIALVISVVALVVMGALITAAFAPTYMEQRVADNTRRAGMAFEVAEYGLGEITGNWNTGTWNNLGIGDTATWSGNLAGGQGTASANIRRLNNELFLVDIVGTDRMGQAQQRIGQFFKLQLLDMDIQAALTTRGPTTIGGSAEIDGNDNMPAGWAGCSPADTTKSGIRLPDASDLTFNGNGCNNGSCIDGNPSIMPDSSVTDSTFFEYGDLNWNDLVSMATINLPPGTYKAEPVVTAGVCNLSLGTNWGDPETPGSPCFGHFPIIYSPGDLTINGDIGQGMLLVEGDLSVQGGFAFYGITVVRGRLKTAGTGGHFNGAVMAANVDLDDITVLGDALVQFSSCAVTRALQGASPGRPLNSRGWLYTM